jgi:uncharacterized protein
MKCPVDKADMIVVEHRRIELDYCLRCSGVWFDSGELDLLISVLRAGGADLQDAGHLEPETARTTQSRRRCPICKRKMEKVWLGKEPKALIDKCPQGDGLWFDGGELMQVLREMQPRGTSAPDLVSFLGDTFLPAHTHGPGDSKHGVH